MCWKARAACSSLMVSPTPARRTPYRAVARKGVQAFFRERLTSFSIVLRACTATARYVCFHVAVQKLTFCSSVLYGCKELSLRLLPCLPRKRLPRTIIVIIRPMHSRTCYWIFHLMTPTLTRQRSSWTGTTSTRYGCRTRRFTTRRFMTFSRP